MTDNSIRDKTFVSVKRIKVSKGLSIQTDEGWKRYELGYDIEGTFENLTQIDNLEDNALYNIEQKLQKWAARRPETHIEPFDINKIFWKETEGQSGPFQISTDRRNPNFINCVRMLSLSPERSCVIDGWFVWVFKDGKTLGRKPSRGRQQC